MKRALFPLTLLALSSAAGGVASPSDAMRTPTRAQLVLMLELRACRNVDHAGAVPADVVSSCPKKKVRTLVGVSRDDLFNSVGEPTACRRADGSSESWSEDRCHGAANVVYAFYPPCKAGRGAPVILDILFSSANVVTRSRWVEPAVFEGILTCVR